MLPLKIWPFKKKKNTSRWKFGPAWTKKAKICPVKQSSSGCCEQICNLQISWNFFVAWGCFSQLTETQRLFCFFMHSYMSILSKINVVKYITQFWRCRLWLSYYFVLRKKVVRRRLSVLVSMCWVNLQVFNGPIYKVFNLYGTNVRVCPISRVFNQ